MKRTLFLTELLVSVFEDVFEKKRQWTFVSESVVLCLLSVSSVFEVQVLKSSTTLSIHVQMMRKAQ